VLRDGANDAWQSRAGDRQGGVLRWIGGRYAEDKEPLSGEHQSPVGAQAKGAYLPLLPWRSS